MGPLRDRMVADLRRAGCHTLAIHRTGAFNPVTDPQG